MATQQDKIVGGVLSSPGNFVDGAPVAPTLVNSVVVAPGGGGIVIYGYDGRNEDSAAKWIMVFDAAAVPANGAQPLHIIGVPPAGTGATAGSGNFGFTTASIYGEKFKNGIVVAVSTQDGTLALDTASKTALCVDYDLIDY
jgi:hypothetical protein